MKIRYLFSILLFFFCGHSTSIAQQEVKGDPSLPSTLSEIATLNSYEKRNFKLTVEDFLSSPEKSEFKISPHATYMSFFFKDSILMIQETETQKQFSINGLPLELVSEYFWASETDIILLADIDGKEFLHLYSVNIKSQKTKNITDYENTTVRILNKLPKDSDHIIIAMNKDNFELFEPYLINIKDGTLKKLFDNSSTDGFITDYYFSDNGNLKAFYKQENGKEYVLYYKDKKGTFEETLRLGFGEFFLLLQFIDDDKNPNLVYALSNLETDKRNIVLYDLAEKKVVKTLFSNERYDIDEISSIISDQAIDYYSYQGIKKQIIPTSKKYQRVHQKIEAFLGDVVYTIEGVTVNKKKLLILAESDKIAGRYYLYDLVTDRFKLLADLKSNLDPKLLVDKTSFTFYSRDSLLLEGYYYKPLKANTVNKAPLLVIPHGGPYDIRNEWQFTNHAQLFANRGYCVLEINFRGSLGYGKTFQKMGFNQVGRKMLYDIEDGVAQMMEQEWVDEERVAIYGPSYGGLTVLQSLMQPSNVYKCGIDYCGPSNLFTLFESFPPSWQEYIAYFHHTWYDPNVEEEAQIMKAVSPFFHLERIQKPLFVIHGANDPRVNISESDQLVKGLRDKGITVPYLVKHDEGHGFLKEKNNIELNKAILGFLARHL